MFSWEESELEEVEARRCESRVMNIKSSVVKSCIFTVLPVGSRNMLSNLACSKCQAIQSKIQISQSQDISRFLRGRLFIGKRH